MPRVWPFRGNIAGQRPTGWTPNCSSGGSWGGCVGNGAIAAWRACQRLPERTPSGRTGSANASLGHCTRLQVRETETSTRTVRRLSGCSSGAEFRFSPECEAAHSPFPQSVPFFLSVHGLCAQTYRAWGSLVWHKTLVFVTIGQPPRATKVYRYDAQAHTWE